MNIWIYIFAWLTLGWVCSRFALTKGRNPLVWFALGVVLGLLALLLLFILPAKTPKLATAPATSILNSSLNSSQKPIQISTEIHWYFLDSEKRQHGPVNFQALKKAWEAKEISTSSYVWNEEMENWQKIGDLPDLFRRIQEQ